VFVFVFLESSAGTSLFKRTFASLAEGTTVFPLPTSVSAWNATTFLRLHRKNTYLQEHGHASYETINGSFKI
jgi:hypothetical protein